MKLQWKTKQTHSKTFLRLKKRKYKTKYYRNKGKHFILINEQNLDISQKDFQIGSQSQLYAIF